MPKELLLTAAQEGIYLGQQLAGSSPIYNAAQYFEISGAICPESLEDAILICLHECEGLRSSFHTKEANAELQIHDSAELDFRAVDLSDANDPKTEALKLMREDLAKPMDLTKPQLFRNILFKLGEFESIWYFAAHHILLDGYGFSLVTKRISEIYTAFNIQSTPPDFNPGTMCEALEEDQKYRSSPAFKRDQAFWKNHLADYPEPKHFYSATR